MTSYYERKERALMGYSVLRRDDPGLPQWNASDKWNHHNYSPDLSEAPQVVGAYKPFELHACDAQPLPFNNPPHSTALGDAGVRARSAPAAVRRIHRNAYMPQATMEFGLARVSNHHKVLELAPDQSKYVVPNRGDIGRMIFHPI